MSHETNRPMYPNGLLPNHSMPDGPTPQPGAGQGAQGNAVRTSPLAWRAGGAIVCHVSADQVPRVDLPKQARPIRLHGRPAYHVTLISRRALEPIGAWMAQVWPHVTGSVFGSPSPTLGSTLFRAEEPSKGRVSWYLEVLNPRGWMAYTGTVTLAIDAQLRAMGRAGFVNTDADRLFHVSVANLDGDPMHSVGIDAASRSSVILTPETPSNPTPERNP